MEKPALRLPALIVYGIYALYGLVLAPLYTYLINDIVLTATVWLDAVDLLLQYAEILGFAALLGFLIQSVYRHGLKGARPMYALCLGALAFKYVATILSLSFLVGALDLTGGLTEYLFAFLLEAALAALAVFLCYKLVLPAVAAHQEKRAAAQVLGKEWPDGDGCTPIQKPFALKNPLVATTFWSMLSVVVWRFLSTAINDLYWSLEFGFGMSFQDVLIMIAYWIVLILLPGFLGYLLSLGCIRLAERKKA